MPERSSLTTRRSHRPPESQLEYQAFLHQDIETRVLSESGVNIDEELSNMVVFQNAYQASARIVQTANEMFDILLNLGN